MNGQGKYQRRFGRYFYGIQRKMILMQTMIFGSLFLLAYLGVNHIMKMEMYDTLMEQYSYLNDRMLISFEKIYEELDQLTSEIILNEYVQKSMTNQEFTAADREMMKQGLVFRNRSYLDYYLVVDNKGNMYSQGRVMLGLDKLYNSFIYKSLGDGYSDTRILWARDVVFGTYEMSFFVVRYIHEMNTVHEPGVLILKLNDSILDDVRASITDDRLVYFIVDGNGEVCFGQLAGGKPWGPADSKEWRSMRKNIVGQYYNPDRGDLEKGILNAKYEDDSRFTIITYAPSEVSNDVIRQIQFLLGLVFVIIYAFGIAGIIIFTRKLTQPIAYLSGVMGSFDESRLGQRIHLDTNTELDQMGDAYNSMVERVGNLMAAVKKKERELRESEQESLMYQIRPHFLYNTLDTIYMLARISKEATIMHMIQSLSRFLRINLSNGNEEIPVEKELEHVGAYLEIQKIRNAELFTYEVETEPAVASWQVMKMILQPVAENCIKYGFQNIYEGGMIWIRAYEEDGFLCLSVKNNGEPIGEEQLWKLNSLETMSMDEMDARIKNRQGGYGISNVVKRLLLRYGNHIRFYYRREEDATECIIKIERSSMEEREWEAG